MTDLELLESAAKAAGYTLDADGDRTDVRDNSGAPLKWNPLEDDGDALRLAVALDIRITPGDEGAPYAVAGWWVRPSLTRVDSARVPVKGDRAAALRRAVVMAAAAIGSAPERR